jgi:hypothetical protein
MKNFKNFLIQEASTNPTPNHNKFVKEETSSNVEGDYEGEMARNQLKSLILNAEEILKQIGQDDELEAWVQSKITNAADYISTVKDYMAGYEKEQNEEI